MINFFYEDTSFRVREVKKHKDWILSILNQLSISGKQLNFIFCSDEYLLKVNQDHLNHDYYTDIITFPIETDPLEADVFISIERVKENAQELKLPYSHELRRVMSHGLLHLNGLKDKTKQEKLEMRKQEDKMIRLF